jgi:hydrogenase maturation factor
MDCESDKEPGKIIKVDEEYEVTNGLLGVKRDIILKLTTSMNGEYELQNLFNIGKEMSVIKDSKLFKMLRYFPPTLEIKNGQMECDDYYYEIRGNREFVSKELMMLFIIDFKMYKNRGIYRLKGVWYIWTFYSVGIDLIEYANGIFNFMTDNHCCFYDSCEFENVKLHE